MRIGRRRHPLELQKLTRVSDGMGGWQEGWSTIATEWAAVDSVSGDEYFSAAQLQTLLSAKVTMPYRADLTTEWRLIYHGKQYNVKAILPNNDMSEMTLLCEVTTIK